MLYLERVVATVNLVQDRDSASGTHALHGYSSLVLLVREYRGQIAQFQEYERQVHNACKRTRNHSSITVACVQVQSFAAIDLQCNH